MADDIKARFEALMKPQPLPPGFNPDWPINSKNVNMMWRWDTLEDVFF